ncbi:MAG: NUDIX hydrolase [Candidatus Marinimicrobia bacterium]|nr:NUDIX hydrolase [Candidatus Neomarinimicrobiota bacterium]
MELKETQIRTEHIFKGKLLDVWRDVVSISSGRETTREYIKHPGAVAIIPILPGGKILLIRQFRYALGEVEIEIPAGKIDPGESLEKTVIRELEEETGYRAGKITQIGEIHPCIGYSNERIWLYLAEELKRTSQNTDHDEMIELFPCEIKTCLDLIQQGEIKDVKAIIGLLWTEKILSGEWSVSPHE